MKRITAIIILLTAALLCSAANAGTGAAGDGIRADRLTGLISEFSGREGFEVVRIGRLGTSIMKRFIGLGAWAEGDSGEAREVRELLSGLKKLSIVEYGDCSEADREKFERRLGRVLADEDIIMEIKDGGDMCRIYGVVDDAADKLSNFVLYDPSDCTLICLFGTIPMSAVVSALDA